MRSTAGPVLPGTRILQQVEQGLVPLRDAPRLLADAIEARGHHFLILQRSDAPGMVDVPGFETLAEGDLDRAEAYFRSKGRPAD